MSIQILEDKRIVLGVSGSIAVYKAADLASKLAQAGALVDVVMTREAQQFVTPLTFRSLTHRAVARDLFDPDSALSIEHVALAETANVVVIAPATANIIAKLAHGLADDLLTCILLATKAPVIVAPAMDGNMFQNPATQENLLRLEKRGVTVVGPAKGRLASGLVGVGRMGEPLEIVDTIRLMLGRNGDLAGRRVVVTAGGTHEPIDPVRVIGNRSSGKMGFALAEAARDRGAEVTLIATGVPMSDPVGLKTVRVETAEQMRSAVTKAIKGSDALLMAAAVADYRPEKTASSKIKKNSTTLTLQLVRTPDILGEVKGDFLRVGFAAESDDLVKNAKAKLVKKGLDLIVGNDITAKDSGFSVDTNRVVLVGRNGNVEELPLMSKYDVANKILDRVVALLATGS